MQSWKRIERHTRAQSHGRHFCKLNHGGAAVVVVYDQAVMTIRNANLRVMSKLRLNIARQVGELQLKGSPSEHTKSRALGESEQKSV